MLRASERLPLVAVVGLPLQIDHLLYNCAAVLHARPDPGRRAQDLPAELPRVLRGAPVHPGRRRTCARRSTCAASADVPFGSRLLFRAEQQPQLHVPRRDLRGRLGAHPALVLRRPGRRDGAAQPSASNITVGKADYRHSSCAGQSARCLAAYLYSRRRPGRIDHRSGLGRPRRDLRERHPAGRVRALQPSSPQLICSEIDLERISQERMRQNTFGQNVARTSASGCASFRTVRFRSSCRASGRAAAAAPLRALPLRPADPTTPRRALRRGLSTSRSRAWPSGSSSPGSRRS